MTRGVLVFASLVALTPSLLACSSEGRTSTFNACDDCDAASSVPPAPRRDASADATIDAAAPDEGGATVVVEPARDGAAVCVPTESAESACNGKDDDCDGIVDNVDVGRDGICDCLGLLILGETGPRAAVTFDTWLRGRGTTVKRRIETNQPELAAADLVGIDVVVLDQLKRDPSAAEVALLVKWVKDGGALVAMTGYTNAGPDSSRPNAILEGLAGC